MEIDFELELIEEEELLEGLLSLTSGNLGAAYSLLEKAKKETVKAVKAAIQQAPTPLLDAGDQRKRPASHVTKA